MLVAALLDEIVSAHLDKLFFADLELFDERLKHYHEVTVLFHELLLGATHRERCRLFLDLLEKLLLQLLHVSDLAILTLLMLGFDLGWYVVTHQLAVVNTIDFGHETIILCFLRHNYHEPPPPPPPPPPERPPPREPDDELLAPDELVNDEEKALISFAKEVALKDVTDWFDLYHSGVSM